MKSGNNQKKTIIKVNMAQTLDGHTVEPGGGWALGSKEDKRRMDRLRLWADCLIASRRSIEVDNPNLIIRSKKDMRHPAPIIVMRDTSRKIDAASRIFQKPHPPGEIWVYGKNAPAADNIITKEGFNPDIHGKWKVYCWQNVTEIYDSLQNNGYRKILLEGGPHLNGLFLQGGLIDEIYFTLLPYVWGGTSTDRIIASPDFLDLTRFKIIHVEKRKNEVFFRYKKIK